ncbi:MAG: hypothetical protein QXZ48_00095 [Zestosphaera sp.]
MLGGRSHHRWRAYLSLEVVPLVPADVALDDPTKDGARVQKSQSNPDDGHVADTYLALLR